MPSHSPELQPAERLWPLTNEPIANRSFETLDELEEVLCERCLQLLKQPELIRRITCYHALADYCRLIEYFLPGKIVQLRCVA
jgi:hypothetical protein